MKHIQLFIVCALISSFSLTAQNSATKKADKLFAKYQFVDAIEAYNKLVEKGEADAYVYSQLAEANYNIYSTEAAEKWYAKAFEAGANDAEMIYKYSEMLKANGKYEASNTQMDKFAAMKPSDDRAMMYKSNPDYLSKILDKGKTFNVQNLDINTATSDFGGTLQDGKLYITSSRNDNRKKYGWNEEPFLDIYEYTLAEDGTYQGEELLDGDINTKYHEGIVSFTPDGKTMYFSRESFFENIYEKDSLSNTKYSVLHLFKATKDSDGFSEVEALSINSPNYSIKNPSVSADGSMIYFASDMPGGYGKFDIYKATLDANGNVGTPENLGQKVNTEGQEMFPYISSDNTLYFSSTGHLGLGGMDVFHTKEIDGKMAPIRNAGTPINSNGDDFAFRMNEETGEGFVSSNREGGKGSDDIYAIKKLQPLCDVLITGTVVDEKTGDVLAGATTSLADANGNILATKTTNAEGVVEYIVECETDTELQVTMEGYESNKVSVDGTNEEEVAVSVALTPIEEIVTPVEVILNPIYFEFDKSNITAKAAFELDNLVQVMNKYPDMVIEATSHTDFRGSDSYNQGLSERRAQTTRQYIISKGIDASRISASGKGETEPAVDCNPCSKDQHQLNRRSQFLIVKQ
ncbi:OmpA family protein [Mesoflavibacter zeaxanthinifaciens]|uniref:Cell envelope biogenesis protein OmpA n=2 Tax=Mesoflavibacter TaxID=444051 RepID=A0A2T1NKG8_9FLAO|nr:OmpA family protein [Mesoflavibacter zeaxanthinifaciens]PSG87288.1 cell envelope biogenesis protein OmpA [Mesoflavibacter zeaxanthinifaciens subsp. sabulilitoris]PSG92320.1 cell envelope biogenesis protein OmpA [Mesoflavibacter zeaxanthinifaciens subsp. sabulilitoris]PSG93403.1 cell envelope biogenesis protein OmpA [Mesoflavibacter zeaxanthinifaciens subsp. sabulilitoris]